MTVHAFNFGIQERLRKIPFFLFNTQNFQSLLYTAIFCNFITPMYRLEFCYRNVTASYPSVILLTSPLNLWIRSFTTWCHSISNISNLFQLWFHRCGLKFYLLTNKNKPQKIKLDFEIEMSFAAVVQIWPSFQIHNFKVFKSPFSPAVK